MKLTADIMIKADRNTVWSKSQDPQQHVQWDIRFSDIVYLRNTTPTQTQRFRYVTRLGFGLVIEGWGESVDKPDKQASVLKFGSDDPKSLITEGNGAWVYRSVDGGVRFSTVYDYSVRYGLVGWVIDVIVLRPIMLWAVRWSFDRLRIWIEQGTHPAVSCRLWLAKIIARVALAAVWIHEGVVPKLLFVRDSELELVTRSGLILYSPKLTLAILGTTEIAAGAWLLFGKAERLAALLISLATVVIVTMVVMVEPSAWTDPFGGVSKNLGLFACAATVWILSPWSPHACNAKPMKNARR